MQQRCEESIGVQCVCRHLLCRGSRVFFIYLLAFIDQRPLANCSVLGHACPKIKNCSILRNASLQACSYLGFYFGLRHVVQR